MIKRLFGWFLTIGLFIPECLLAQNQENSNTKIVISGWVREAKTKELLVGASVFLPGKNIGVATNAYGFFSLSIPAGIDSVTLQCNYIGYKVVRKPILPNTDQQITLLLENFVFDSVVVEASRTTEKESQRVQMSSIELPVVQVQRLPGFMGEKDVLKVLQLMPGVQKGSEGYSGLYVRGGGPDQNLILLDGAPVYNAFHLFGFFSVFNGDALKSIELIKGGFPARYGGRLSSVLELNMKDGSKDSTKLDAAIGYISSSVTAQTPLAKGKSSLIVSARRTYLDLLLRPFIPSGLSFGYYFYDFNAKFNYEISNRDKLYVSTYFGRDKFFVKAGSSFGSDPIDAGLQWGNGTATLRWNHLYNQKLFSNLSLIYSNFIFNVYSKIRDVTGGAGFDLDYRSVISDFGFKYDFDYFYNNNYTIRFGWHNTLHRFKPNALVVKSNFLSENISQVKVYYGWENAFYMENELKPTERLKLNAGFRLSSFAAKTKTYVFIEPRLAASYYFGEDFSAKVSYAEMNQFIHLLSNTGAGLPTDYWVPSTDRIRPQHSKQAAVGLAKDFEELGLLVTLEGYHKKMEHVINYKEGASFLILEESTTGNSQVKTFEDVITTGQGWSQGIEFLAQKKTGQFQGWIGYTLSKTEFQFDELNMGKRFYARYDRRHDISVVGLYEYNKNLNLSATWVYGTGNAITLPFASYKSGETAGPKIQGDPMGLLTQTGFGFESVKFSEMNGYRMADYMRLDFNIQMKKDKVTSRGLRWSRTHEIGVYNVLGRRNPYFVYLSQRTNGNNQTFNTLSQVSIFGRIIGYSFRVSI